MKEIHTVIMEIRHYKTNEIMVSRAIMSHLKKSSAERQVGELSARDIQLPNAKIIYGVVTTELYEK